MAALRLNQGFLLHSRTRTELEKLVSTLCVDSSFGIFTRQAFRHIVFPQIKHRIHAIVFADLDNLHEKNTEFGYNMVDRKIRSFFLARKEDVVLRWFSGDELVWILFEGDVNAFVDRIAERFNKIDLSATFASCNVKDLKTWPSFELQVEKLSDEVREKKQDKKRKK